VCQMPPIRPISLKLANELRVIPLTVSDFATVPGLTCGARGQMGVSFAVPTSGPPVNGLFYNPLRATLAKKMVHLEDGETTPGNRVDRFY